MLCFDIGLKHTIYLGTTHQTVGINNPNTPVCPPSSSKGQTREAGDEADIPRGRGFDPGQQQRKESRNPWISQTTRGSSRGRRRRERRTVEKRSGGTRLLEEEEDEKREEEEEEAMGREGGEKKE